MRVNIDKYSAEITNYGLGPERIGDIFRDHPMIDASAESSLDEIHTRIIIRGVKILLTHIIQTCDPTADPQRELLGGILTEEMLNARSSMMHMVHDACELQLMPNKWLDVHLFKRAFQSLRIQVEEGKDPFNLYVIMILQLCIDKAIKSRQAILSSTSPLLKTLRDDIANRRKAGFDYPVAIFEDDEEDSETIYLRDLQEALRYATAVENSEFNLRVSASNRPYMTFQDEKVIAYIEEQDAELARQKEKALELVKEIYEKTHEKHESIHASSEDVRQEIVALLNRYTKIKNDIECLRRESVGQSDYLEKEDSIIFSFLTISDDYSKFVDLVNQQKKMLAYQKSVQSLLNAVGRNFVQKVKGLDLWRADKQSIPSYYFKFTTQEVHQQLIDCFNLRRVQCEVHMMIENLKKESVAEDDSDNSDTVQRSCDISSQLGSEKSSDSFVMRIVEVIAFAILAALFIIIGMPYGPSFLLSFSITFAFDRTFTSHTREKGLPTTSSSSLSNNDCSQKWSSRIWFSSLTYGNERQEDSSLGPQARG